MTEKMNKGRTKLDNKIGEGREGKGREGKGREGKGSGRRRCVKDTVGINHCMVIQQNKEQYNVVLLQCNIL